MQRIIWIFQLFQLYICHINALYAKLPSATETLPPSWTKGHPEQRAVPSEMITCGYKNGDPAAMTKAESGSVCRFSTQNGLWGMCKSAGDPKCTVAGRCRDQHDCSGGCGKTENPKFRMTSCKKIEYCSFAYLIMDEGHKYTYVACGAVAATDTYYITPKVPPLSKTVTQKASTIETSELSSDTTAVTETSTTSSESATETTEEASNDNTAPSGSNTGAIVGGVVGGLAVICGTGIAAIYLLRRNRSQKSEATPETGQGTTETPDQTVPNNGPKELVGSKPGDVQAKRQTAELQGTVSPRRSDPVELP
ncbi:hypothetical protein F53441_13438 [Fusarium austroafricanum]|uniref:Mid2 domain-containing protein n=1 Tax=Fusarium austroafricanum TaxID=2364996 RepID=A0A8H4NFG6_9HYPO|nr:hypothetical protein F53441_13438 [Fusarium austroafricanum]